MNPDYFGSKQALADHLGIDYVEFLKMVSDGRFPVQPKPKDPTPVWLKSDVLAWQERKAMIRGEVG